MVGKAKEKAPPPDHLRCNRTDGRQWRCIRRSLDGKKLCEIHYLQGRHRQFKRKVPDSLKLERKVKIKKNKNNNNIQIGASNSSKTSKVLSRVDDKEKKRCVSEALDEALNKMKLKRGDLQLELIRVFLKRQLEKKMEKREKEIEKEDETEPQKELELPNAVMAISTRRVDNAGDEFDIKLGSNLEGSSSAFSRRHFRSKNIEPPPISTMQQVPFAELVKKKRRRCHWCKINDYQSLIKCLNCKRQFFCVDCIRQRYLEKKEISTKCPVCRGACSCESCVNGQSKTTNDKKSYNNRKVDKVQLLQYLIYMLLPVLAQINQDQSIELEMETKITDHADSDMLVQQAETSHKKYCCSNCKTSIVDYHRSCANCSYNLCLSCCWGFRDGSSQGGLSNGSYGGKTCSSNYELQLNINAIGSRSSRMPVVSPIAFSNLEADGNGSISCPPAKFGGCGEGLLQLRCILPLCWTKDLEVSAAEMLSSYNFPKSPDDSSCLLCKDIEYKADDIKLQREVARRVDSGDNFLYCPTMQGLREEKLEHFQEHWGKGHPTIVRSVLRSTSELTWDPVAMFCNYLEKRSSASQNGSKAVKGTNCLDWCEIEIANRQTFLGSLEGQTYANMRRKTIKFNAGLSPDLFLEHFPAHYAATLRALPLQEYMNPASGLLNLAVKLPGEMLKPELGPSIYISYGSPEEFMQPASLTKLCYDSCDVVNILAYATDDPISQEQLGRIKNLMKKYKGQDCRQSTSTLTDQKEKSPLRTGDDTEVSGLKDMTKRGLQLPNGFPKVPFHLDDSLKARMSSVQDGNSISDYEHESESDSDSEASILCCGTIEGSEDLEGLDCSTSVDKQEVDYCGAQWDIFRRQDVPKLMEYLQRHSNELSTAYSYSKHVVHPILDQTLFLDAYHKLRLKEEFDIQPWTFEQQPGEAIIIPAGCPYQIKKLKSCVNIVLDFISPESVNECINLTDEIRHLPLRHKAKGKMLEVKKMALYGISDAVEEIRDHMQTTKTMDGLMDDQHQS